MPDAPPAPAKQRRPRGPALSADRIADEALALIDAEGIEAFSFRTLAARLGCQAMSIYNYYPSKAHLFEALVEIVLAEAAVPDRPGPWQDRLRAALAAYRRAALNHPGFFVYFATFRMNNRAGLAYLNGILRIFQDTGLPVEAQARHFRILSYYLTGACLDETLGYARGPSATRPVPAEEARRDYPAIMAVGPFFAPDRHQMVFDAGVEILIAGIEAELSAPPPRPARSDS
jgi:AcrR family transcriptional regulator